VDRKHEASSSIHKNLEQKVGIQRPQLIQRKILKLAAFLHTDLDGFANLLMSDSKSNTTFD